MPRPSGTFARRTPRFSRSSSARAGRSRSRSKPSSRDPRPPPAAAASTRARAHVTGASPQAFPPSITGKGAVHGGSVLDHAFGKGDAYTLGVEEGYQLLDGESFDLVQHIDTMLAAISGHELEARINPELMQSVIE